MGLMKKMKIKNRSLFVGLLLVAAQVMAQGESPRAALVRVAQARLEIMATTTVVPGTVISRNDARVAAEVEGRLTLVADIGTPLRAGDPVAIIEDTILKLRRQEAAAEVVAEEARLEFLSGEEKRLTQLETQNNAARNALEETRSKRKVAQSNLIIARVRLAQLDDQLERTRVAAPFDGVIVERLRQTGERVKSGDVVVRMVNPDSLELIARAPLDYLPFVRQHDTVSFSVAGQLAEGVIRTLVAVGDENTHLFEVRVDIPGGSYPVGQTVRLTLPASASREVLAVPRDALVLRPGSIAVFIVGADNKAERVEVTTGLAHGAMIEVHGAVQAGDTVVVRGNERLRSGQQVQVQQSPEQTQSAAAAL